MNERIKQLAEEANIHFSSAGILDGDPNGSARMVGYYKLEKFAELLVKECIKEIKTGYRGDFYTGDLYDCEHNTCIDEQVTSLEEYFGVNK
tara:strand:+ start:111 stop:383 length:273 start_codon:yes stop_codon:yes gene_type:complete